MSVPRVLLLSKSFRYSGRDPLTLVCVAILLLRRASGSIGQTELKG